MKIKRTSRARTGDTPNGEEERYRQLVDLCPCAILVHARSRLLFVNDAGTKLLGADSSADLIGRPILDFVHPDAHQQARDRVRLLEQGRPAPVSEESWLRRDGAVIEVVVSAASLVWHGTNGKPVILLSALDVTGRKPDPEILRLAVNNVADYAIFMVDPEGRVTSWNAGAELLTGYSAAEAIGRHMQDFFAPDHSATPESERLIDRAARENRARYEGWFVRKNNSRFYTNWVITAVRGVSENVLGYLNVARDLTGYKTHEEEIERWNTELEHRVAERTAQIEAANRELESFSYSVSHDLRAPLRHIDGFVEILQDSAASQLDEDNRQHLQTIADSARQMGKLIDDLLAFSRMSRVRLNVRPVSLEKAVREAMEHAQRGLQDRRVEWSVGKLPDVEADPDLLRQVLINLIGNALKYTRTREVARIDIGANQTSGEVIFFIRDNGVGFDPRYMDKLFGVFQRLHRSAEFEGTGLGLANVRRIIHRHAGRTWAEGTLGAGATFYFSLPAAKASR